MTFTGDRFVKVPSQEDASISAEYFRKHVNKNTKAERFVERFTIREFPAYLYGLLNEHPAIAYDVLDVGCGPASMLGDLGTPLVALVAVDALAGWYNRMLAEEEKGQDVVRPTFGLFETLDLQFGPAAFDLVYSENSLDHCHDPAQALRAMSFVLRPGRWAVVEVYENEANKANDTFHNWNVCIQDGRVLFSALDGRRFDAAEVFGAAELFAEMRENPRGSLPVVHFRLKKGE